MLTYNVITFASVLLKFIIIITTRYHHFTFSIKTTALTVVYVDFIGVCQYLVLLIIVIINVSRIELLATFNNIVCTIKGMPNTKYMSTENITQQQKFKYKRSTFYKNSLYILKKLTMLYSKDITT